jgi:hypothetical protein
MKKRLASTVFELFPFVGAKCVRTTDRMIDRLRAPSIF